MATRLPLFPLSVVLFPGTPLPLHIFEPREAELPQEALPLSFHVAAGIDVEAAIKQRLLAERSTARRVDALLLVLPALSTAVERALVVHRRAHGNGRGNAYPTLPTA